MLTLNQIAATLQSFLDQHAQIKQVVYAWEPDFKAMEDLKYPVGNFYFQNANISGRMLNLNFKLTLADVVEADNFQHEQEVVSDMIQVVDDLSSFLQYHEGWSFTRSGNIVPFTDVNKDRTAGVTFQFQLSVVRAMNECQTPLNA